MPPGVILAILVILAIGLLSMCISALFNRNRHLSLPVALGLTGATVTLLYLSLAGIASQIN
jgi:hypothetical protein